MSADTDDPETLALSSAITVFVGVLLLAGVLLSGCGGSTPGQALPSPSPSGDVSKERLQTMLLQSSDLPGLTGRRR